MQDLPVLPVVEGYQHGDDIYKWNVGEFIEREIKNRFLLIPCNSIDKKQGANFRITSIKFNCIEWSRPVKLLKTVVYVGVDENPDGSYKWEKWGIRNLIFYPEMLEKLGVKRNTIQLESPCLH